LRKYRVLKTIVYSNFFIAICTLLMTWETAQLLHFSFSLPYYGYVFCGTLCSYSFHWLIPIELPSASVTERQRWNHSHRKLGWILLLLSALASIYFSYFLLSHWHLLLASVAITFLYSTPKISRQIFKISRTFIDKTFYLAGAWVWVTSIMPLLLYDFTFNSTTIAFILFRFFLVYSICLLFDYKDKQSDLQNGISSLVILLSEKLFWRWFYCCGFIALVLSIMFCILQWQPLAIFSCVPPIILLGIGHFYKQKSLNDLWYYFVLDGLLCLSALLLWVTHFLKF